MQRTKKIRPSQNEKKSAPKERKKRELCPGMFLLICLKQSIWKNGSSRMHISRRSTSSKKLLGMMRKKAVRAVRTAL